MRSLSEGQRRMMRERYPVGTRVELLEMDDPQAPPVGTKGTVQGVDDVGQIMVHWDTGSSLSLIPGVDRCRVLVGEFSERVKMQILAIRDTGKVNMFDFHSVQRLANYYGYHELVLYLMDHKKEYAHYIMTGEEPR